MSKPLAFPMPNDHIGDRTVVASVVYIDDERGDVALVLLLEIEAPYLHGRVLRADRH